MTLHQPIVVEIRDRDHWMELRSKTVGASESAALFETVTNESVLAEDVEDDLDYEEGGEPVSPYQSPLMLWALKTGRITAKPRRTSNRIEWGTTLEPIIAERIALKKGWTLRRPPGYYIHPKIPRMGASLDFEVETDGTGRFHPLEIKNVADTERWKWKNAVGEWVVPGHIMIQVQHQLAVTGLDMAYIGVLFGGNDERVFEVPRDEALIAEIEAAVTEFWQYVDNDQQPETNIDRDGWVIRRLYAHADPEKVLDWSEDESAQELVALLKHHTAQQNFHKKEIEKIKTQLYQRLGDAGYATLGDVLISAVTVEGQQVSYYREPYRAIRTVKPRKRHVGRPLAQLTGKAPAGDARAAAGA